ncbi:MAG: COX15/CtaA family protein [Gammaproteobacteria bacterium]|nr:COX15/CtaA family protein [Gammaproteobacteria bacterium]
MRALAIVSLLFVLALVSVSAYLRLQNSGIGCPNWPACYGQIGPVAEAAPTVGSTYERLALDAQQPMSWATPVHRLVASVLGLLVLGMALMSLRAGRDRLLSFTLLGLTVFLAWLGIYSGGLHNPAVVMGNLGGGFAMLGLLGWMVFRDARPHANASRRVRRWVVAALVLLCIQIGLGGLTSANFAATACMSIPDCHGTWMPGGDLAKAFDLTRQHEIGPSGHALGGAERGDIHKLHRLVAIVTLLTALLAGGLAVLGRMGATAVFVIVLVALEFGVGVAAILADLPIGIAVAHNWLAAILLLGLLRLFALCRNRQALL